MEDDLSPDICENENLSVQMFMNSKKTRMNIFELDTYAVYKWMFTDPVLQHLTSYSYYMWTSFPRQSHLPSVHHAENVALYVSLHITPV